MKLKGISHSPGCMLLPMKIIKRRCFCKIVNYTKDIPKNRWMFPHPLLVLRSNLQKMIKSEVIYLLRRGWKRGIYIN